VAKELYEKFPDATLLTSEIGGIGFEFKGKIIDGAGLITPSALKYHPMKVPEERPVEYCGAIPVGIVRETSPDIVVSYDYFMGALEISGILQSYEHEKHPVFTEDDILLSGMENFWSNNWLNVFIKAR